MLTPDQWKLILAPGVTPPSDEAMEWFTSGARTEHYEMAATALFTEWPSDGVERDPDFSVLTKVKQPEAASWTSYDESLKIAVEDFDALRIKLLGANAGPEGDSVAF